MLLKVIFPFLLARPASARRKSTARLGKPRLRCYTVAPQLDTASAREYDVFSYPGAMAMSQTKVAISIEEGVLAKVDALVRRKVFSNRSRAIQEAVLEKLERLERTRLAEECAKLDPALEKAMADEGLSEDLDAWPKY
jgi:Arc/MetJ-type ribon-helix-helix transcriptional regulator